MSSKLQRLCLLAVAALMLGACELNPGNAARNATATAGATKAGNPGSSSGQAYPGPGTPTAIVAQPAPTLAPAPVVAPAASAALVGPEWTILASGDLNGDKIADLVGIKLAQGVVPDATFTQPGFSVYKGPASEIVIVQAGGDGKPQIQAILTGGGLSAAGVGLASFSGAAGYMVSVTPGVRPLVSILPINQAGAPLGRAVGLEWTGSGYALFGRGK